jgi:enamine deaminase RidA (YjgF/YER057c/UK114 family)
METGAVTLKNVEVKYSFLKDPAGNWMELYYSIVPSKPQPIDEQVRTIEDAEKELLQKLDVREETAAFKRFFSSDLMNHRDELIRYKERQPTDFFFSLTEQPPAPSVKLALLGMCLSNITKKHRAGNIFYFDTTSHLRHIFAEHLTDPESSEESDSEEQTAVIFELLKQKMSAFNVSVQDSVLRTWLYTPHVDADYPGIVKARKAFFDAINLTQDTHYIASTGIQGGTGERFARVSMDAYAVSGVDQKRIRYIHAPEYMSPTHVYGVTFERATAIDMGHTGFLFISGTASIDKEGEIVHPGDIARQTERTLENISALLDAAEFTKQDLSSLMVYLRDPADYDLVKPIIDEYVMNLPVVYMKASVCRPGWLIEIEATAGKYVA